MTGEVNNDDHTLEELVIANGVNGTTGEYLTPEITEQALIDILEDREKEPPPENLDKLKEKESRGKDGHLGPVSNVDPKRLGPKTKPSEKDGAGWGVIYGQSITDEIKEALSPLIALRQEQAGNLFQTYDYQGESSEDFLIDHGVGLVDAANPEEMPYYLLLVGAPEDISFQFQFEIAVDRALGRIFFDTVEEYSNYANSVVAAEKGEVRRARKASFFGVLNPNDLATDLSTRLLIEPLLDELPDQIGASWKIASYLREQATRTQLESLLGGQVDETPALLFTASHGIGFERSDNRQSAHQGALVCSDWQKSGGRISEDVYFAGEHLSSDAQLHGLISFFFACYGAGTPSHDEFMKKYQGTPKQIAPQSFVAKLPQRMLSHPRGGALAVIGHVDRAWTHSFKQSGSDKPHIGVINSTLYDLIKEQYPVGHAMDVINTRYGSAATRLTSQLEKLRRRIKVSKPRIIQLWTIHNDARDYIILGDPAVRLCVSDEADEVIEPSALQLHDVDIQQYKPGATIPEVATEETENSGDNSGGGHSMDTKVVLPDDAEAMGVLSNDQVDQIKAALKSLSNKIAQTARNLSTMEVLTYLSDDDLSNVYDRENKHFHDNAKLKAVTLIGLDGDIQSMVPSRHVETLTAENRLIETVEVDQQLLDIHREMVNLAQTHRTAFLKSVAEVATTLVNTRL